MKKSLSTFTVYLIFSTLILGQQSPVESGMKAISSDVLKAQLGFLASDITEGREAGTKGEYISSEYLASLLQLYGVKPAGDYLPNQNSGGTSKPASRSYFQNFTLIKSTTGTENVLRIISTDGETNQAADLVSTADYVVYPSGESSETEAPVVFAGYGFKSDKLNFNDFKGLDLKGKFVLKISGIPAFAREKLSNEELNSATGDLISFLKDSGAIGLIEFNPSVVMAGKPGQPDFMNTSPSERYPRPGPSYSRYALPSKTMTPVFSRTFISARAAVGILYGTGIVPEECMKNEDLGHVADSRLIAGKKIYLKTDIKVSLLPVRNVLGVIEGNNPEQVIVLGAHYDHMGMSNGYIWNGADDNGSGTVGVLTIAKAIMATGIKPDKTIIIALWTSEEEGLLGSHYYVNNLPFPLKNLKLNMNFDMISRYISNENKNGVEMVYTKSCIGFRKITETNIKKYGIDIKVDYQPSDDPPGGSDHRSFAEAGIPVLRFRTAHPPEYHTPADEVQVIDWDIMEKIVRISFADIWDLSNSTW